MRYIFLFLLIFLFSFENEVLSQSSNKWIVVLDAGHGGKDSGALGKHSQEKNITLSIVLKIGEYIQEHFKDVKIIYTRTNDTFVDLYHRADIANDAKANLFISVHCNSTTTSSPNGSEVFVMGLNKTDANLHVAMQENKSILFEKNNSENYDGIDPNSTEAYIAFSLYQNVHLDRSLLMAKYVTDAFNTNVKLNDRGIKQAPFFVLYKTTMPSILIETAFISNSTDEAFLLSKSGQNKFAYSVYTAFVAYRNNIDKANYAAIPMKSIIDKIEPKKDIETKIDTSGVIFRIQFASFKDMISTNDKKFAGLKDVICMKQSGYYKYFCGKTSDFTEIKTELENMRNLGYKDAFIVAFNNGNRIDISEAKKLIENK